MRVIAGIAKGRPLRAPGGRSVRPTSDKVRGAIFSILLSRGVAFDSARVLDLFAGTGAMGIEALSRGAREAVFVEADHRAIEVLERNLQATGFAASPEGPPRSVVLRRNAEKLGEELGAFDLVFVDPPYALVARSQAIATLARLLTPVGMAVVEHDARTVLPDPQGLVGTDHRRYGSTAVSFYRRNTIP